MSDVFCGGTIPQSMLSLLLLKSFGSFKGSTSNSLKKSLFFPSFDDGGNVSSFPSVEAISTSCLGQLYGRDDMDKKDRIVVKGRMLDLSQDESNTFIDVHIVTINDATTEYYHAAISQS